MNPIWYWIFLLFFGLSGVGWTWRSDVGYRPYTGGFWLFLLILLVMIGLRLFGHP